MQAELGVLLIEDNSGDVRLIEEMLSDAHELLERIDSDGSSDAIPKIHHEKRLSDGLDFLASSDVDVVLLDLNLPDSAGLDTLETAVEETRLTPIVVLTGLDDRHVGIRAIQEGAQDYLVKDEVTSDALVRSIHYAIERVRQERERRRRRQQLEALNRLNQIAQDVTRLVITTSSREELEQALCDRLVESDAYRFAWIGEVEPGSNRVSPRSAAGVDEEYLEEITVTVNGDETANGPTGRAIETHEVQVMQNIRTAPDYEPWREQATEYGYRSSVAVPILHEGLRYGVLNVYASSPDAFSGPEAEILGRLGQVIGHAIASIERKDALVSDAVLELEFRIDGIAEEVVSLTADESGPIRIENFARGDESVLVYGIACDVPRDEFCDAIECTDAIDDYRLLPAGDEGYKFEAVLTTAGSLFESVASHGGRIESATAADGELRFVVEFPREQDARRMIDLIEEQCPGASLVAQRTSQRSPEEMIDPRSVLEDLTDRQRAALETAYVAGYFDWPRRSTGEEVADRLGITSATFTQHLRAAEQKVFQTLFGEVEDDGDADAR